MASSASKLFERIVEALEAREPANFALGGPWPKVQAPHPGLVVDGYGPVALPLPEAALKDLTQHARRAPFGHDLETRVDESVRKTWEIDDSKVKFLNPEWEAAFKQLVAEVSGGLECSTEGDSVRAELYKLLVYDEGSMFKPHQDTEKAHGHFATLVIQLPSRFEGGAVTVRHKGEEQTFDFCSSPESWFTTYFTGFFTDCTHDIAPVTSGCRLALVYNLVDPTDHAGNDDRANAKAVDTVAEALKEIEQNTDPPPQKLVYILSHRYTEVGREIGQLKDTDATVAATLQAAARKAGWRACVAECGLYAEEYDNPEYEGGKYAETVLAEMPEEDLTGMLSEISFEWETFEKSTTLDHVVDLETRRLLPLTLYVDVDGDEMLPDEDTFFDACKAGEPDDKEYWGYFGNEGVTRRTTYSRSAIVMWPITRHVHNMVEWGCEDYDLEALCRYVVDDEAPLPYAVEGVKQWAAILAACEGDTDLLSELEDLGDGPRVRAAREAVEEHS